MHTARIKLASPPSTIKHHQTVFSILPTRVYFRPAARWKQVVSRLFTREREPGHDGRRGEEPLNRASYSELFPSHGRKNGGGRARRLERSMHSIESSKESRYARLDDALKGIPKLGHPVSNWPPLPPSSLSRFLRPGFIMRTSCRLVVAEFNILPGDSDLPRVCVQYRIACWCN